MVHSHAAFAGFKVMAMLDIEGVGEVHAPHAWTITSGIDALSGHVVLKERTAEVNAMTIVELAAAILKDKFDVKHSTIQVEYADRTQLEPSFRNHGTPEAAGLTVHAGVPPSLKSFAERREFSFPMLLDCSP